MWLRKDIEFLADPRLDGRAAGAPGADTAANFIARRFTDLGLSAAFRSSCDQPARCAGSYLQPFRTNGFGAVNVGTIIPGSDSTRRGQYVAVSAHFDHLGRGGERKSGAAGAGDVHPGADDNASGTAAVLELARRFRERPTPRSVIVLAFGAEELGLIGSRVFVDNAPVKLRHIVLAVNLDMVGRLTDGRLTIHGAEGRRRSLAVQANTQPRFSLTLVPQSSGRSDDYSFVARGVPAMHITTGDHRDYHRATDTADRIDFAGLARVTDYVERLVRAEASRR